MVKSLLAILRSIMRSALSEMKFEKSITIMVLKI